MAPVNKPKHQGKAVVAGATAGVFGEFPLISTRMNANKFEDIGIVDSGQN